MKRGAIIAIVVVFGATLFWAGRKTAEAPIATEHTDYDPVPIAEAQILVCKEKILERRAELGGNAMLLRLPSPVVVKDSIAERVLSLEEIETRIWAMDVALTGLQRDALGVITRAGLIDYGLVDGASKSEALEKFDRDLKKMAENVDRAIAATK